MRKPFASCFVLAVLAAPSLAFGQTEAATDLADAAADEVADAVAEEVADAAEEAEEVADDTEEEVEAVVEEVAPADPEPATPAPRSFEDYANDNPAPAGGSASPSGGGDADWRRLTEAELLEPTRDFPYVEWHGYFRFRADSFWNLDLDTFGTSAVLPPIESVIYPDNEIGDVQLELESAELTNADAEHLAGANIRMRLRPTFHITEKTRLHLELNILDNMMLGSTPDGYNSLNPGGNVRGDVPLVAFSGGQEPPNTQTVLRDSISVTQAYGEVNTFFGTIRLGRMASHWGLGILANGGGSYTHLNEPRVSNRGLSLSGHTCLDCDYGDYVDRAMFITNLFDTYLALAWDYNVAGPSNLSADDYFGQPRDTSQYDDVNSIAVALFQRPMQPAEIAARNRTLKELRRPTLDWGAYFVYRRQRLSAEGYNLEEPADVYVDRDARAYIPDIWFRVLSEPAFRTRIRLEGELAAIFGTIGNADPVGPNEGKERDIRMFAAALEFDYTRAALATGFNAGYASGRSFEGEAEEDYIGFNVNDGWDISASEPTLTNFRFDRNYFVDAIMFREVIGTVTNAIYVNPFFRYDLFSKQDDTLGARLDLITAFAANSEATPSGEGFYGVETDLTIFYREPRYGADIMAGLYLPGSAFDGLRGNTRMPQVANALPRLTANYEADEDATPAWTLQGRFFWAF